MKQKYAHLGDSESNSQKNICFENAGRSFNTLAQLGTTCDSGREIAPNDMPQLAPITRKEQTRTLEKRAKSKYFSQSLAVKLLKASGGMGVLSNGYRRTLLCSSDIVVGEDGRAVAHYCKNRWCVVCNRIRTAVTLKKYGPILEQWDDAHFVTLTVRNVTGNELPTTVTAMTNTIQRIAGRLKKRAQRGQCDKFIGIRKFECTANAGRDDFHPHFHFIVRGEGNAHALRRAWLNEFTGHAVPHAQDVQKADTGSIQELFKYASKLVVKVEGRAGRGVYADMQNVIFESIRGMRTLQSFGFKLPAIDDGELQSAGDNEVEGAMPDAFFVYDHEVANWVEYETGELLLSSWSLPESIRELSANIIVRPAYRRNGNRSFAQRGESALE